MPAEPLPTSAEAVEATRWRLDIAYDGTAFSGWATQPGLRTVQGELERWTAQVLRLPEPVQLTVAGRTDAGVHARGQVAHVDLPVAVDTSRLQRRLERVLDEDLQVLRVSRAPEGFDARFSALWRRYVYRVWDEQSTRDPLLRGHITRIRGVLDVAATNHAARMLLGLHDFAPFCKPRDGATTIRTLTGLHAERTADGIVEFTVTADAFCHSMVRSLMGAMTTVGTGRKDQAWLAEVMGSPKRHNGVLVMPAKGLCLEEVRYPADDRLAERANLSRAVRTLPETSEEAR
ncbi:tRNA pseudouridine(38-40) synthase TruA [Luteococcus japonicus]|uniref:tRNA pseudouridine synthase A n=1 Tax=Luteococcus japonicus LSP_Lj1 TaxID=1255658 RepID=A0A1R4IW28_9ACTN|nr:tRNA pseudouridine(38-40) synthase TruA [Luteococcus japonicus]SJN24060.1 tRNA pseudouridine synthase A [Luteococcus japonicus LSP_Lj1]